MIKAHPPNVMAFEDQSGAIITVITVGYVDGRILQQFGEDQPWRQIKPPDNFVAIVGNCKDCGEPITEDMEWNFSKQDGWVQHGFDEDCKKDVS